jgi:glycosyltransferase involved in cell wall biosynthesis
VISTNAGGLPEIIIDGDCGYMSKVGDVEDMSKNSLLILEDEATHEKFRQRALEQAKRFDISTWFRSMKNCMSGFI